MTDSSTAPRRESLTDHRSLLPEKFQIASAIFLPHTPIWLRRYALVCALLHRFQAYRVGILTSEEMLPGRHMDAVRSLRNIAHVPSAGTS